MIRTEKNITFLQLINKNINFKTKNMCEKLYKLKLTDFSKVVQSNIFSLRTVREQFYEKRIRLTNDGYYALSRLKYKKNKNNTNLIPIINRIPSNLYPNHR